MKLALGSCSPPNAVRCYEHLGVGDALSAVAVEPEESVYRRFDTAEEMLRAPLRSKMLATYGARYFHVHRADLLDCLLNAVSSNDPDAIATGHVLSSFEETGDRVFAQFENGVAADGDVLIACDGIHSVARGILVGDDSPRFTGQFAWRGMVPSEGLPASVVEPNSVSWLGERKHIIQYGVRGRQFINYVAIVASDEWTEEGWNCRASASDVVDAFADWHPDVLALIAATPEDGCYKWGLFDREPLDNWTKGRVTLLGDAAHPMLPFMAQGSAMAVEDAVVLARALAEDGTASENLRRYENVRRHRTNGIIKKSRQATSLYQRLTGDKSEQRATNLDDVYGYDATKIVL